VADGPTLAIVGFGVLAAGAGLAGLIITLGSGSASFGLHQVPAVSVPAGPVSALPGPTSPAGLVPRPVSLVIPAIGVRTRLVDLGVTKGGMLQVPPTTSEAGWYTGSPRPGAIGSSVIVGHVDSYSGPGVFFRLGLLRPSERIYVRRADGSLAVFRVASVHTYLKSRFPTAAVYGPEPGPQLRLITCGGTFNRDLRSYLSNVVVYAVGIGRVGRSSPRQPAPRVHHQGHLHHPAGCGDPHDYPWWQQLFQCLPDHGDEPHGWHIDPGGCAPMRDRCPWGGGWPAPGWPDGRYGHGDDRAGGWGGGQR
jgi:hypothetical protein